MKNEDARLRSLRHKLAGLHQCVSELETSEEDLLKALGAGNHEETGIDSDILAFGLETFLFGLAKTVESRDLFARGHLARVSAMSETLGKEMGLPESDVRALRIGGILHDIGKIEFSPQAPGLKTPLNHEKGLILRRHPEIGYHLCLPLKTYLGPALDIILQHHENLDGSGYPHGIKGARISLGARIVGTADLFDNLITDRPGGRVLSPGEALTVIRLEVREGKFDQEVVNALVGLIQAKHGPLFCPED